MVNQEHLSDGSWLLSREQAEVYFSVPKPGVVVIAASGPGDTLVDDVVLKMLAEETRSCPLKIFADLSMQTRIASETREKASAWAKAHRTHVEATHLLIRSKLVEMAFSVIGMLVSGRFKFYSNSNEFYTALRAEVPDFKAARSFRIERPRGAVE
jgi:hypothetical protein